MASEDRCEAPTLCVNGCGFFGTPAARNLCSKCYRELDPDGTLSRSLSKLTITPRSPVEAGAGSSGGGDDGATKTLCGVCNRKLGLLISGYRCRCGGAYCMRHRLPESHACLFDFKAAGRDALSKANSLVNHDKKLPDRI